MLRFEVCLHGQTDLLEEFKTVSIFCDCKDGFTYSSIASGRNHARATAFALRIIADKLLAANPAFASEDAPKEYLAIHNENLEATLS